MNNTTIKEFYNHVQFPGPYDMQGLAYHMPYIRNPYLSLIDKCMTGTQSVLDVGCGSGLISNLFGMRYPDSKFVSVDFSNGIDYAKAFANENNITNIKYKKQDFLTFKSKKQFDVIICQGVLHHIPDTDLAIENIIKLLKPGGLLVLGVYHPLGKLLKTMVNLNYKNRVLYEDQELNPFELAFTKAKVVQQFSLLDQIDQWPKNIIGHAAKHPISFSRSGGLVGYVFTKTCYN